jgi:histidinol-phosphate aminotransferase
MEMVLNNFNGLVAVDEAYINFARQKSFIQELSDYPNLVVLQTFSKAWGMAGLRLGIAMAPEEIVSVLNKVKPPYNINAATQQLALQALNEMTWVNDTTLHLADMRNALAEVLERLPIVEKIFPSDANFLLVKIKDARKVYEFLLSKGIVVRDRSKEVNCENCLRITIGTEKENTDLIEALNGYRF